MNEQPIKQYSVKLNTFKYLSYIILVAGFIYIADAFARNTAESLSGAFTYGIIILIIGGFFYYFGRKSRKFLIYENRIEYWTAKLEYSAEWNEIMLIKTYQEMGKQTENLIIMTENENTLSISTAFFDSYTLKEIFNDLVEFSKNFEHISVEDDRKWLENKKI